MYVFLWFGMIDVLQCFVISHPIEYETMDLYALLYIINDSQRARRQSGHSDGIPM